MKQGTRLLNTFSVSLKRADPFMTVYNAPIYKNGDYFIYKFSDKHFVYTFKNIVISERGGINKEMVNGLVSKTPPTTGKADLYFLYQRPIEAIAEGLKYAKDLNFEVK